MAPSNPGLSREPALPPRHRSSSTRTAFLLGLPLGLAVLGLIRFGPLQETVARRYVSHPVECVEVIMFCMALGALAAKMKGYFGERRACRVSILPDWNGKAIAAAEAIGLLQALQSLPRRLHGTWIVDRASAIVQFVHSRGSATDLDDHLRCLADNDAVVLESSYSLTRFITWAIPILGFLGTVLGITGAISGVTPEVLEQSLGTVTDGLALAFDTTALALGLTMLTMFLSFIVERSEQSILEQVDRFADRELAHRFERSERDSGEFIDIARRNTDVLVQAVDQLMRRQTALWSDALAEVDKRQRVVTDDHEKRLTAALQAALDRTLETHAGRLVTVEKEMLARCNHVLERLAAVMSAVQQCGSEQHGVLSALVQKLSEQIDAVARLGAGGKELHQLQETLNHNLAALTETGRFEEALHSLTAAVHLLTARASPATGVRQANRSGTAA